MAGRLRSKHQLRDQPRRGGERRDFIPLRRKEVNGLHGVKDGKQNRGEIKKSQDGVHAQ